MPLEELKKAEKKIAGMRQTMKAIENNIARAVYIARDAEEKVTSPAVRDCMEKGIPLFYVDTMAELGKACNIKVGASMAAILTENEEGSD
ncbi:MAG: 50S ribosomal protein L7Ae-like protein [Firmicutes bacterium]|nr:50S ribosomal protein L7Ae-like protein [Bacillota bacterium]